MNNEPNVLLLKTQVYCGRVLRSIGLIFNNDRCRKATDVFLNFGCRYFSSFLRPGETSPQMDRRIVSIHNLILVKYIYIYIYILYRITKAFSWCWKRVEEIKVLLRRQYTHIRFVTKRWCEFVDNIYVPRIRYAGD